MLSKEWLQRRQVAIYAVAVLLAGGFGLGLPASAALFERLITPVLAVLLYATFLEVPFVRFRRAFTNGRFMALALGLNFLVVPVVVYGLTRVLPQEPILLVGALLVLLTPCIDYVIPFSDLAGGDAEQVTAATPVLLVVQLLLLPVYLWLFVGRRMADIVEAGPFLEAFFVLIGVPLTLAWLTELWANRSETGERWQATIGWVPVPMMAATLLVVIASQLPRVWDSIGQIAAVVPVYVAFLVVMPLVGRLAAGLGGLDVGEARALVFTATTRNSLVVLPLALALPAGYELAPAVVVTQTLVELIGMVVLTRVVPAWLVPDAPAGLPAPTLRRDE
ncbi:arsenic resistance protein [Natrinema longum]|uniref:Arsenic resistance protein n=1 Tax=Natrinema longum TaxID=370324 RepID=A0A8A2U7B9_9EURY|nr:arsenic resistance protein [Natrinema longum]MBZ6494533.1 arsenic resistance protein [Natrinema longum]QSW84145.1 arsenic resistance protein [Natrinema longum]